MDRRLLLLCLAACGDDVQTSDTVTISGKTINHSMNRLATQMSGLTPEVSYLTIAVNDAATWRADPAYPPLASGDQSGAGCETMGACAWSFDGYDVAWLADGLASRITDMRSSYPVWITTFTAFGSAEEIEAAASSRVLDTGRGFLVSRDALDNVVGPLTGLTGTELLARGIGFGLVYNGVSADGSGAPVIGATVTAGANATIVYPNNNFSGATTMTASQGAFLVVPTTAAGVTSVAVTVTAPGGSWAPRTIDIAPDAMSFALLFAN